ncbi:MAG: hypothetical protein CM1200mP14_09740 [Gammaproteobacteria bacterium]|nr:MAG: hypothetical protein CM1200mP14_09740 [Gammaproteobacteria bacterium]
MASSEAEAAPSFYADVLPVLQQNCVDCHRPNAPDVGGITAPMSLMTYAEAYRWAPRIKRALRVATCLRGALMSNTRDLQG